MVIFPIDLDDPCDTAVSLPTFVANVSFGKQRCRQCRQLHSPWLVSAILYYIVTLQDHCRNISLVFTSSEPQYTRSLTVPGKGRFGTELRHPDCVGVKSTIIPHLPCRIQSMGSFSCDYPDTCHNIFSIQKSLHFYSIDIKVHVFRVDMSNSFNVNHF